jgi:hypothetical protein
VSKIFEIAIAASAMIFAGASSSAKAASPFDGVWLVRIVIDAGPCARPPGYRYPVEVVNGRLRPASQSGDSATIISGTVDAQGSLHANVTRGTDRARGSGQLSGASGGGVWNSDTRGCSGTWTAARIAN